MKITSSLVPARKAAQHEIATVALLSRLLCLVASAILKEECRDEPASDALAGLSEPSCATRRRDLEAFPS